MKVYLGLLLCAPLCVLNGQSTALSLQCTATGTSCAGKSDGKLHLTLLQGAVPALFTWSALPAGAQGSGQLTVPNLPIVLSGLSAGSYQIHVTAADGADTLLLLSVPEPLPLGGLLVLKNKSGGYALYCADGHDGEATLQSTGGTPPLNIAWSNGESGAQADSLGAGQVFVSVTDAHGCFWQTDTSLNAPPPLNASVSSEGELCLGQNSGQIAIESVGGGSAPYEFALSDGPFGNQMAWVNLPPGAYFPIIRDAAGCLLRLGVVLPSGLELGLDLDLDTTLLTGDTLLLKLPLDSPADTFLWQPATGIRVIDSETVLAFPAFSTVYALTLLRPDGCRAQGVVHIHVRRDRQVYAPNVLAPAAQLPENQSFTLYAGDGIRRVNWLQVYDRFGRRWFENRNFPMGDPASGWQGSDGADAAPAGVYLWRAEVEFSDGRAEFLQGDVTVVR